MNHDIEDLVFQFTEELKARGMLCEEVTQETTMFGSTSPAYSFLARDKAKLKFAFVGHSISTLSFIVLRQSTLLSEYDRQIMNLESYAFDFEKDFRRAVIDISQYLLSGPYD